MSAAKSGKLPPSQSVAAAEAVDDIVRTSAGGWEKHGLPHAELMTAVTTVLRAQQVLMSTITRQLQTLNLTFGRYEALVLIELSPEQRLPIAKTSERLMLRPSSATGTIDWLETQGLVERVQHPHDRRVTEVAITPKGSDLAIQAMRLMADIRFGLPDHVDEERAKKITDALLPLRQEAARIQRP